jgi:hypothetical protein
MATFATTSSLSKTMSDVTAPSLLILNARHPQPYLLAVIAAGDGRSLRSPLCGWKRLGPPRGPGWAGRIMPGHAPD